jgi:dTDP-4-dehydrorhamnose reductase
MLIGSQEYIISNEGEISWYNLLLFRKLVVLIVKLAEFQLRIINTSSTSEYSLLDKSKIKASFGVLVPDYKESLTRCMGLLK